MLMAQIAEQIAAHMTRHLGTGLDVDATWPVERQRGVSSPLPRWRWLAVILASLALVVSGAVRPVAAQDTTTGSTQETWVEAVVPPDAMPAAGPQSLAVFRVVWDAGVGYRFGETTPGLGINCVLDGQWAFAPDRDELVVRTGVAPAPAPAAVETTLGAGECAILHQDVPREERNSGTEPVAFLTIALIPDATSPPANAPEALEVAPLGFLYAGNWAGTPAGPASPRAIALRRITLEPGAIAPALTVRGDALLMLDMGALGMTSEGGTPLVERAVSFTSEAPSPVAPAGETVLASGDSVHVHDGTTVTLRNAGDAAARYWLLTLTPVAAQATPES